MANKAFRPKKGGVAIVKQAFCLSDEERDRHLKDGYAIVAIAYFRPDGKFSYLIEKGSAFSRMLGSK